jgi:hypothetical protein
MQNLCVVHANSFWPECRIGGYPFILQFRWLIIRCADPLCFNMESVRNHNHNYPKPEADGSMLPETVRPGYCSDKIRKVWISWHLAANTAVTAPTSQPWPLARGFRVRRPGGCFLNLLSVLKFPIERMSCLAGEVILSSQVHYGCGSQEQERAQVHTLCSFSEPRAKSAARPTSESHSLYHQATLAPLAQAPIPPAILHTTALSVSREASGTAPRWSLFVPRG